MPSTRQKLMLQQQIEETPAFDPEGEDYDHITAKKLSDANPLTIPKPKSYQGDEVYNDGAFEAWIWHKELKEYKKHGSSRDPNTGLLLKGKKHLTFHKTEAGEKAQGNVITKGEDGRYYSNKPKAK